MEKYRKSSGIDPFYLPTLFCMAHRGRRNNIPILSRQSHHQDHKQPSQYKNPFSNIFPVQITIINGPAVNCTDGHV